MKKSISILLVIFALAVAMPSQAQVKLGIKGGLNLAKADFKKSDFKSDNFTGFFIGPMVDVTIPIIGIGVDGALLFSQRGLKVEDSSATSSGKKTEKENGIEIPINLKYNIGLGDMASIYLAAGPSFFYSFKDDMKLTDSKSYEIKNAQVGINLGAGVKLLKHLMVGANYNIPLSKTGKLKSMNSTESNSYKSKMWQVSVAYLF